MPGKETFLILALAAAAAAAADFSGTRALAHVRRAVELGPRPAGSPAIRQLQSYIREQLKQCGCQVSDDEFTAATPIGAVPMKNILARFPGASRRTLVITGHYDTKPLGGFVGANDGGSSTGFLLELARALVGRKNRHTIVLVWLDGEEAFQSWSATDGTYGSRHLAAKWEAQKFLPLIDALINVDMIGDRGLDLLADTNSTPALLALARDAARETGATNLFADVPSAIEDDHIPFVERRVPAVDLIDFNYGPGNSWWHTPGDTIDKLDGHSLEIIGKVVLKMIERLDVRVIE